MQVEIDAASAGLLDALTGKGDAKEHAAITELRRRHADEVPAGLRWHYHRSKRAGPRAAAVFYAMPYARWNDEAYQLGVEALDDSSKVVRYRAAGLLAYSLRAQALTALGHALGRVGDDESRAHFRAAIDAVENGNHHLFRDRDHSGMVSWEVDEIPSHASTASSNASTSAPSAQ